MEKEEKSVTKNLKKENFLTRDKYVRLLRIIGLSAKPLSSYEIKQEYIAKYKNTTDEDEEISNSKIPPKNPDNYIYNMIHQLTPNLIDDSYEYGFNWNKIIENKVQQNRVLNYICKYFKIDLKEPDNNFKKKDNNPLFSKSKDDKIIKIENQSKHITVSIEKTRYNAEVILNENNEKKILSLKVKNDAKIYFPTIHFREPFDSVMNTLYRKRPHFLDINYVTTTKKKN